jgi:DNA-binding MarR family transcriptional regulator
MSSLGDLAESSVLALPASGAASIARIDAACRCTAAGKLAARDIAAWLRGFQVTEPEFRLLWLLSQSGDRRPGNAAFNQAELAELLVVSPAQVSGAVERLRSLEMLERTTDQRDRRRQHWRLTHGGRQLLSAVVASVAGADDSLSRRLPPLAHSFERGELLEGAA